MKLNEIAQYPIETEFGRFQKILYENTDNEEEYVALVVGEVDGKSEIPVRVHSQCLAGDSFRSLDCDCGPQLWEAMKRIQQEKAGVIIYLFQEGKGHGLKAKTKAKSLMQKHGIDIYDAYLKLGLIPDPRKYAVGAAILTNLGVKSPIRLLTNNPNKIKQLEAAGFEINREALEIPINQYNVRSLRTQRDRYGNLLSFKV